MLTVDFEIQHDVPAAPRVVWDAMIDWERHGEWAPATRVEIDEGDPTMVGGRFTGYTGYGPLMLVDRMVVSEIRWDEDTSTGFCEVEKVGPLLSGTAGFTISPKGSGSRIDWFEKVTVERVPSVLGVFGPPVSAVGALGFSHAMKRFSRTL